MALLKKGSACVDGPVGQARSRVRITMVVLSALACGCEEGSNTMTPREPAEVDANDEGTTNANAGDNASGPSHQQVSNAASGVDAGAASTAPGRPIVDAGALGALLPIAPPAPLPLPLPIAGGSDAGALGTIQTMAADPATTTCALEFTRCTLTHPLSVDQCLDEFGVCEVQTVGGDAGYETGCSARVAACILSDPLGFDKCVAEWSGKCPGV